MSEENTPVEADKEDVSTAEGAEAPAEASDKKSTGKKGASKKANAKRADAPADEAEAEASDKEDIGNMVLLCGKVIYRDQPVKLDNGTKVTKVTMEVPQPGSNRTSRVEVSCFGGASGKACLVSQGDRATVVGLLRSIDEVPRKGEEGKTNRFAKVYVYGDNESHLIQKADESDQDLNRVEFSNVKVNWIPETHDKCQHDSNFEIVNMNVSIPVSVRVVHRTMFVDDLPKVGDKLNIVGYLNTWRTTKTGDDGEEIKMYGADVRCDAEGSKVRKVNG